jgi:diacylglycerol kinase family enzyme
MMRGHTIEIESTEGFPFHADGEVIDVARKRLRIEIRPAMLTARVGTPAGEKNGEKP